MLGDRHHVLRAGAPEQVRPAIGVEVLGLEHGDEIFVSKFRLRAVSLHVVLINWVIHQVHITWIPFVVEGGNRIDAPVNEDPELRILIPFRHLVGFERFPIRLEWTLLGDRVNLLDRLLDAGVLAARHD